MAAQLPEPRGGSPGTPTCWRGPDTLALLGLFVALFALIGRGTFYTSDEGGIFNTALSLLQHRSLAIAPGENVHKGRDNRYYACREILPSLLSMPFCVTGMVAGQRAAAVGPPVAPTGRQRDGSNWPIFLTVTLVGPLLVALTLVFLHVYVRLEGGSRRDALWLAATAGLGTPLAVYSKTLFPQVIEAALVMLAFLEARRWRTTGAPRYGLRLGLAMGLGLMTRAAFGPTVLVFLGYLVLTSPARWGARCRATALFLLLASLGAAVTGLVNWLRWGSPLDFGYHHPYETFSTALPVGVFGLLASLDKGLWVYAPAALLPLLFVRSLWQRGRAELLLALALTVLYLLIYGRWFDWGGGLSWGPRFLVPLIAPWLALLGRAFAGPRARPARVLLAGSFAAGFAVQLLGVLLHPQWMHFRHADAFAVAGSHLPHLARVLWQQGPDDLWLWARAPASSAVFVALVAALGSLTLGAMLVLIRRATSAGERRTVQLLGGLAGLLILSGLL